MSTNNPPAFPTHDARDDTDPRSQILSGGMTLRDYIATAVLPSVVATCAGDTLARKGNIESYFAAKSYSLADAMLAERNKP